MSEETNKITTFKFEKNEGEESRLGGKGDGGGQF